jgi:hypothetical protein
MEWVDLTDLWQWRDAIIAKVRLIDLIQEYGMELIPKQTGLFTHQIRCPFHEGKNGGREKTPSFFISDTTNSYNCFACGAGGTIIDFVSSLEGILPVKALEKLAKKAGFIDKDGKWDELQLSQVSETLLKPRETIDPYLFEISHLIRKHIKQFIGTESFEKEFRWAEKLSRKVDDFIGQIDSEDCEYAIELVEKIRKSIEARTK